MRPSADSTAATVTKCQDRILPDLASRRCFISVSCVCHCTYISRAVDAMTLSKTHHRADEIAPPDVVCVFCRGVNTGTVA